MKKIIASNIISQYPEVDFIIQQLDDNSDDYHLLDDAILYFGFPKFSGYEEDGVEPDLLLLSPLHGILVIRFYKKSLSEQEIEDITEELYSLLFSKLNESKKLRKKRGEIIIPIETYVYFQDGETNSDYIVNSIESIKEKLEVQQLDVEISTEFINETKSIIEGTKALSSVDKRYVDDNDISSKAFVIGQLENEIKTFDFNQLQSAVTIIDGPQRIRGLAGSGKTVVLAMKAAQIHINEPDKLILFTFYTKSLYQQIKNLITRFYRHYKKIDPNWNYIHVKHAWGGQGIDGVYYSSCKENEIQTINFAEARQHSSSPFDFVCKNAFNSGRLREKYDFVLIDEAQDLPPYFFRMVYSITKNNKNINEKNIVWGYDDLQNIFNVGTKSAKELFGTDSEGKDLVDLERASKKIPKYLNNDIVLHKCYRNPRSVLLVAHSLGFGFYNKEKNLPVQILENKEHWEDLGYKVLSGDIIEGSEVRIERPSEHSPLSVSKYLDEKELIQYQVFANIDNETTWVVDEIDGYFNEGLNPEDILIISLDDKFAKNYFSIISGKLMEKEVLSNNLLLNPYTSTDFINQGHVTLSTVHRAKGNEAPVVFVVGIDAIYGDRKTRSGRNKIFTAFTRTKCCLKVSGIGEKAAYFFHEIDISLDKYPNIEFVQPSKREVETIQRDLSDKSKRLKSLRKEFYDKLKDEGFSDEEIHDQMKFIEKI